MSEETVGVVPWWETDIGGELDRLRSEQLYRTLRRVEGCPGPTMVVDGRPCLMLASSNYLDLAGDQRVVRAAADAAAEFGTAAAGSRLINGNLSAHEMLEADLADFCGFEAALVFSTGYMANLGVITSLCRAGTEVISDELNHASIIDACRLSGAATSVFRHNDPDDLDRVLSTRRDDVRRRVLVLDGVFSMDGDVAPLADLIPLARRHDALVVLDDAHGLGVLGATGRGSAEAEDVTVDVLVGNLGKALGSFGAFVACSARVRDMLVNTARSFIFTCALAPPALGAARRALQILEAEPERARRLWARADQLRSGLQAAGYHTGPGSTHIVPAIVGENQPTMDLADAALQRGVYAQGIRYPSVPRGTARIRFTPSCGHSPADIEEVVDLFAELRPV